MKTNKPFPNLTTARWRVIPLLIFSAAGWVAEGYTAFAQAVPTPRSVVVLIEENHGYSEIIGSPQAPYINSLANQGALFTNSHAISHPSQPNYLALFSGSTQGVTSDRCPHNFPVTNLETELIAASETFAGYSEGLPSVGSEVCAFGSYTRRHAPWTNFPDDISSFNQPFRDFPTSFAFLPTVTWVIPNLVDDMHNGSVRQADTWLKDNLSEYVAWSDANNSLLIVTWDEDQGTVTNRVPTIFVGPMVKPGKYSEDISHYNILRTIEDMYSLPYLGKSASATPITDVWR
jgi:phosphatidylinositol-3-phosphatase